MTLTSDAEKRLVTLNRLVKDFLGRVELGDRARRKADDAGNVVEAREIFRLMQEDAIEKGKTIVTFLETSMKNAERIPARIVAEAERRKLSKDNMTNAAASANAATKKITSFYRSIRLFMDSIVRSFERGIFPGAGIDTLRVYMVKSPEMEKSHAEALLAELDKAETAVTVAPAREDSNAA